MQGRAGEDYPKTVVSDTQVVEKASHQIRSQHISSNKHP